MKRTRQMLLFVGMLAATLGGCDALNMDSVPDEKVIREWVGPFLVEADQIKGVYRNLDVDSLVLTYHTAAKTEKDFSDALSSALKNTRWKKAEDVTDLIEFRRSFKKGEQSAERPDMAMFASFEVVRLGFDPRGGTVVVAYVQADESSNVSRFEDTSEGRWAEKAIWPKFNELRKRPLPNGSDNDRP